jgi:hypothetical protein
LAEFCEARIVNVDDTDWLWLIRPWRRALVRVEAKIGDPLDQRRKLESKSDSKRNDGEGCYNGGAGFFHFPLALSGSRKIRLLLARAGGRAAPPQRLAQQSTILREDRAPSQRGG